MARKKVEPGHEVVNEEATNTGAESGNTTVLDDLMEGYATYQPDMAPLAAQADGSVNETPDETAQGGPEGAEGEGAIEDAPDTQTPGEGQHTGAEDENTPDDDKGAPDDEEPAVPCTVVLKKGATFRSRGVVFVKDTPVPVAPEVAEKLLRSGMFERG